MDTTENELRALRKELDEFRNENIALYNELTKQNKTLCEEIISLRQENLSLIKAIGKNDVVLDKKIDALISFCANKHLYVYLIRLAGMQTAAFIAEHMKKVKAFNTREEHLKYALSQAEEKPFGRRLYMEFGVFEGQSINLISSALPDKIIYGFDSFEGLPENWREGFMKGEFNRQGKLPQVNENVRLVKSWFNETLPAFVKEHSEPCAFIHIDCDLYSSTKTVLDLLRDQIVPGTVISFDEYYNYPGWQEDGEYKAFNHFVAENNVEFEYVARSELGQVSIKIK